MQWALVDSNGIVVNLVVYDGVAEYEPPTGLLLQEVNSWLTIGNNVTDPDPNI